MGDNVYPKEKKTENNCKMMWRVLSLVSVPAMYVFTVTGTVWVKVLIHVCCGLQTDESLFPIFFIKFIKFLINFDFRITQNPYIIIIKVLLLIFIFYFVHVHFACLYVCAPLACMAPSETRKGHQITWHWSCCQGWAAMCVLGLNHGLPGRTASSLSHSLSILSITQPSRAWQWL